MPITPSTQLQGVTDLTVIALIKPGLIDGVFDSRSYRWRLERVLRLLDAARHAVRESDEIPAPMLDSVARLRGIHFFRFAVVPPGRVGSPDAHLLLNVTFDGGWEPYMRLIWKPLGTLLDLIFCHCEGYPLAAASSYDDYIDWVRSNEVASQFFYADSAGTVADRAYLEQLDALWRGGGAHPDADRLATQTSLRPMAPPQPTPAAVLGALRILKGLFQLEPLFGRTQPPASGMAIDDASVLLRFAQDLLPELRTWFANGLFDPGQQFDTLRPNERERQWLMTTQWTRAERQDAQPPVRSEVQSGILDSPKAAPGAYLRGAVLLVRVVDAAAARAWLAHAAAPGGLIADAEVLALSADQVLCNVAITYPGLVRLEVDPGYLQTLPFEFVQGMEARAGVLGDLRCNHPQQWRRPRKAGRPEPVDLGLVHLVVQLRTRDADADPAADRSPLLPRLQAWIDANLGAAAPPSGLEVLAVEPGWSRPALPGEAAGRDHFGFVDGLSQPKLASAATPQFWDDGVKAGELLLGFVNDRGDGPLKRVAGDPPAPAPGWTQHGSFLVLRKIRQFVDRFDAAVAAAVQAVLAADPGLSRDAARELVRAKLMGRRSDGSGLVTQRGAGDNDFDYRFDADAAECPFAAHVRRANPRAAIGGGLRPPRIMRRGMSYGATLTGPETGAAERGILFMAYNASIAEQFEVIQRWLAGGNSSGVASTQADPFVGVPRTGERSTFRFVHRGQVLRVDLGDQPLAHLQWGLYAFVPSLTLLRTLDAFTQPAPPATAAATAPAPASAPDPAPTPALVPPSTPDDASARPVKLALEDDLRREAAWQNVRAHSGVEKQGRFVMVGGPAALQQVLHDPGTTYSAVGYGARMAVTLGRCPFGEDEAGAHPGHARPVVAAVKAAIAGAVSEESAYGVARGIVAASIKRQLDDARARGLQSAGVDVLAIGVELTAGLLAAWFGVRYGAAVQPGANADGATPLRCPGHFLSVARYVFSACPNPTVRDRALAQGAAIRGMVRRWIEDPTAGDPQAPMMRAMLTALTRAGVADDERDAFVANVMLGLPATLLGSWGKVAALWIKERRLWQLQHALPTAPVSYAGAKALLRDELLQTMALDPVADGVWRTVVQPHMLGSVNVAVDDIVWLGLGSALRSGSPTPAQVEDILFGGALAGDPTATAPHACPGREPAMGALLGGLAALLSAGEWLATASPTGLNLRVPPA